MARGHVADSSILMTGLIDGVVVGMAEDVAGERADTRVAADVLREGSVAVGAVRAGVLHVIEGADVTNFALIILIISAFFFLLSFTHSFARVKLCLYCSF